TGRRSDDDLSVRHVCSRMGNFVQCASGCGHDSDDDLDLRSSGQYREFAKFAGDFAVLERDSAEQQNTSGKRSVTCAMDFGSPVRIWPSRYLPGGASLAQQSGATVIDMGSSMISRSEFPTDFLTGATWLRVKELEGQQESLLKSVICAFNQLLDLRDLGTGIHSTRLAEWAVRIA